jgi:hypothetical protein
MPTGLAPPRPQVAAEMQSPARNPRQGEDKWDRAKLKP